MVVQRTLTPPVGVRSSHPQPFRSRSTLLRFFITGCSAVGSALGSGPRGRGFESRHSDQKAVCTVSRYKRLFCLGVTRLEQPVPAAAGRKSARWADCEGAGESRHPTGATLYRVPVQTAFLSWSAEDSNSPTPPQRGAKWSAVLCENCCHNVKIAKWGGILPQNGV